MSNVLIGIIGVILFIGLAVAGAMILGDDFTSSSAAAEAAAAVSQVQQMQAAVEMWRLKTGQRRVYNGTTEFLQPRFLKTAFNPTKLGRQNPGQYRWDARFNNDILQDSTNEGGTVTATYAMLLVGPTNDARSRAVCQSVADQFNNGVISVGRNPPASLGPVGCGEGEGYYAIWARI